jgi:hypothetical protein
MLNNMNIIFVFIVLYYSSDSFKFELFEEIQLNELNIKDIANTLKMCQNSICRSRYCRNIVEKVWGQK